ncbi:hypothetical protein [Bacillus amyloliquefaciens]|nr:hypothetical protein [Bacillus amyloliquefaciens]MEC3840691.1 hypothetical protein [Bacillus amyloliquefaciens]
MYVDESGELQGIVTEVIEVGSGVVDVAEYEESDRVLPFYLHQIILINKL